MMMKGDIEFGLGEEVEEETVGTLRPAVRRQNCLFALGITMLLVTGALLYVYVGTNAFTSPAEVVLGDYETGAGEVSTHADNSKTQGELAGQGHPFDLHYHNHYNGSWAVREHNHEMWAAQEARWNRTHPGMPFPYKQKDGSYSRAHGTPWSGQNGGDKGHKGQGSTSVVQGDTSSSSNGTTTQAPDTIVSEEKASGGESGTLATSNPRESDGGDKPSSSYNGTNDSHIDGNVTEAVPDADNVAPVEDGNKGGGASEELNDIAAGGTPNAHPTEQKDAQQGDDSVSEWLGKVVTKENGTMYQVVEMIKHDHAAFT
jgi:hypothetical protein